MYRVWAFWPLGESHRAGLLNAQPGTIESEAAKAELNAALAAHKAAADTVRAPMMQLIEALTNHCSFKNQSGD